MARPVSTSSQSASTEAVLRSCPPEITATILSLNAYALRTHPAHDDHEPLAHTATCYSGGARCRKPWIITLLMMLLRGRNGDR